MNTTEFAAYQELLPTLTHKQKAKAISIMLDTCSTLDAAQIIRQIYKRHSAVMGEYEKHLIETDLLPAEERELLQAFRDDLKIDTGIEAELLDNFRNCNPADRLDIFREAEAAAEQAKYDAAVRQEKQAGIIDFTLHREHRRAKEW